MSRFGVTRRILALAVLGAVLSGAFSCYSRSEDNAEGVALSKRT